MFDNLLMLILSSLSYQDTKYLSQDCIRNLRKKIGQIHFAVKEILLV